MADDVHPDAAFDDAERFEAQQRRLRAAHLQAIEDNPLSADEIALFEMFEREGWSHDRRLRYLKDEAGSAAQTSAAE